jgi:hypothetical protein
MFHVKHKYLLTNYPHFGFPIFRVITLYLNKKTMASIYSESVTPPLATGNLKVDNPINPSLQNVEDQSGTASNLQISTEYTRVVGVGAETCPFEVVTNINGAGIAFKDATTLNLDQVGVGAFGNILCLRAGGNLLGTAQLTQDSLTLLGNKLVNFIPNTETRNTNVVINSTNQDIFCGAVLEVTGALNITIDGSVRNGFNLSIIQKDANNSTFLVTGGLTLQNRQGHNQTNGQWATTTIYKDYSNNLILSGDTA